MRRLLLCLPLCLAVGPDRPPPASPGRPAPKAAGDGGPLPDAASLTRLARTDPVAFVEACLGRYAREVKGYRCTFQKQERLGGKLQPAEVIDVAFREEPFSVLFDWREGAR